MNTDPSGMSAEHHAQHSNNTVEGVLYNFFVAPLAAPFTPQYWRDVLANRDWAGAFLAGGVAVDFLFGGLDYLPLSAAWRATEVATRWTRQTLADIGLNVGQAAVASTHGQFSLNAFGQNLEGLPMGMFYTRGLGGFGRRTHTLRGRDIADRIANLDTDTILIYRGKGFGWSSPVADGLNLGIYTDQLIAVSKHYSGRTRVYEVRLVNLGNRQYFLTGGVFGQKYHGAGIPEHFRTTLTRYDYVGEIDLKQSEHSRFFSGFALSNPRNHFLKTEGLMEDSSGLGWEPPSRTGTSRSLRRMMRPFNPITNNCHHHAIDSIELLRDVWGLHW